MGKKQSKKLKKTNDHSQPQDKIAKRLSVEEYKAALSKLAISDLKKKSNKTYVKYTKELYRSYIENPSSNESNIRNMSNFLYRVSMPYRRFINYLSDIPCFYWNLIPQIDATKKSGYDPNKVLTNYYKILQILENMGIEFEFRKIINTVIREGVFYGFIYEDKNSFFIHKLDPDYCRPVEIEAGCYNFAMDMNFFVKNKAYLEYMDPYFQTLYNLFEKDSTNYRWQTIDPERSICIKIDMDIVDENLPLLIGIFEALLDLIDARALQRNKEEIQNYKLIVLEIPSFDDTKEVDDFSIDMDTAVKFYNTLKDAVPEAVGTALSPMKVDTVDFKTDDNDNDLIAASMKSVFNDSGIAQLLFNTDGSGSVGLDASTRVDAAFVWKLVTALEHWMRRYISYKSTGSYKYFFEFLRVDIFNKDKAVERELKTANSGTPNKLRLAATAGQNPYVTLSSQIFENEILGLHEKWVPLKTSYTLTDNGKPEKEDPTDSTAINKDRNGNKDEVE